MEAAWSGESVTFEGTGFRAEGNTMLPRPRQRPRPPLWIGGNSRRAIRRAVESADGWCPFPVPAGAAARTRTAPLRTAADLAEALAYARDHAEAVGRTGPLTVCFIPEGLSMGDRPVDTSRVVASIVELAAVGVDWVSVALPGDTRSAQRAAIDGFAETVLAALPGT
jgi:alkanesulfonate monooxygenase SsuD/methylene tetrahydromethanopterin reductase-like flavin-dependent oxidoreductase (luciferase family)